MLDQVTATQEEHRVRGITQLKYPLPNPDISFERHWEILKAYVVTSKEGTVPVGYKDFGKLTVSATTISANNKFFESIGFISKVDGSQGKYIPTPKALAIQKELTWKREANAKERLAELLLGSWFWESAKKILSMKGQVSESELIDQFGYDSGADPTKHRSSLGVLVEYLRYADLIIAQNGLIALGHSQDLRSEPLGDKGREGSQAESLKGDTTRSTSAIPNSVLFGILISAEASEDQIRKTVRIVLEEIGRTRRD